MKKYILTFITITIIIGCQPILRNISGIKKPQEESFTTLEKYIEEQNIPIELEKSYYLSSNDDYKKLSKFRDSLFRLPDIYLFNKSGKFLEENQFCLSIKNQVKNNEQKNYFDEIFLVDSIISINKDIKMLNSFIIGSDGKNANIGDNNNIAIILWAKFLGNKKNLKHINDSKKQLMKTNDSILIYYLNIDTFESWE